MGATRNDPEQTQREAFEAIHAELAKLQVAIPGLPSLPARPIEYEGWFEDVWKRIQMRSEQRTLDEQIKLRNQYLTLRRQYYDLMKTTYDTVLKAHDFKGLDNTFLVSDAKVKLELEEIEFQRKKVEFQVAQLDKQIKEIREGKPSKQEPQTEEERIRARFRIAGDIKTVRRVQKKELAKCKGDRDLQERINRIANDEIERLMERRR